MTEKLCLKWNDFEDNTKTAFRSLRSDIEFSDVTLACEDGNQMEAHKVILASSSPFFQSLLRKNKHPHPLIYMRGIKSEDLVAIVDFLYLGEVNVYQENINNFLAIAEELKLKGLTGNNKNTQAEETVPETKKHRMPSNTIQPKIEQLQSLESLNEQTIDTTQEYETSVTVAMPSYGVSNVNITTIEELDEQVKSMMTKSQNVLADGRRADMCTVCGKEGLGRNIKDHIEANHLEGVSIPCNFCEKTFRCRNGLRQHNSKHHRQSI